MVDNEEILMGKICPYCQNNSQLIDSKEIYGISFGPIYICKPCDAYVGTHKQSDIALGRLANAELRSLKKEAHRIFDQIWRRKMVQQGHSKHKARSAAYIWLSQQLNTPPQYTHIGMSNIPQCKKVIQICSKYAS